MNFKWEEFNFKSSLNAKSLDAPVLERAFFAFSTCLGTNVSKLFDTSSIVAMAKVMEVHKEK